MDKELHGQDDDLDYTDGLGDLLKRDNELRFSWTKTILSILIILILVFLVVTFGSKYLQKNESAQVVPAHQEEPTPQSAPVSEPIQKEVAASKPVAEKSKPVQPAPVAQITQKDAEIRTLTQRIQTLERENAALKKVATQKPLTSVQSTKMYATPAIKAPAKTRMAGKKADTSKVVGEFSYKVIGGVFTDRAFAQTFVSELKSKGLGDAFIWSQKTDGKEYFRVQVGAFPTREEADTRARELKKAGLTVYVMKK